ncbi:MAG: protein kinase [Chloroflexi bacterium]|nr:protein kinase [Chloroflexota bacterium]
MLVQGRYTIIDEIGVGGMGTVYRATDTETSSTVAIKRLKTDSLNSAPDVIERFVREGEALRRLNHPGIAGVIDTFRDNDTHYIVMQYQSGGDLSAWLKEHGRLPIKRTVEIALDLADALTRAHRLGIIHRDIKPSNVLLADDGSPRLSDFGVAHLGGESVTESGVMVGTLDYIAPEILNGEESCVKTDIWSFGALMFEMLTGERPFQSSTHAGTMMNILKMPVPDLEKLVPDAPVALLDLIYRMLQKDPVARIPSMRLIGAELESILNGTGSRKLPHATGYYDEPETIQLYRSRFATPTPGSQSRLHNLPANLTPFVGREVELRDLNHLIADPRSRLITILAHGGMGKTRLALEVASTQLDNFHDGVYFVGLTALESAENIVPTIAEAIGFKFFGGGDEKQQLLDYLRYRQMLLVMDNFEHLLDGVTIVNDILNAAPDVIILATSREQLALREETRFRISGMDFPDWETPEDALEYSAVKLFVQSARRVRPDFELQTADLHFVARICRLVQGMPLAIVLAAAWIAMLSLEEIAAEISDNMDFLESHERDMPDRHRSVRAVFETSWQRLSEEENCIFRRLAVFKGKFSRRAGQHVTGATLRTLTDLANKSLIVRNPVTGYYGVHELLRQYAGEELAAADDNATIREKHSRYYLQALRDRQTDVITSEQINAFKEIEEDFENVRAAWEWAADQHRVDLLSLAHITLVRFLNTHNRNQELTELFSRIHLIPADQFSSEALSQWVELKAFANPTLPDIHQSIDAQLELLPLAEKVGNIVAQGFIHFNAGITMANVQSRFEEGFKHLQKAIEIQSGPATRWGQAWSMTMLAWVKSLYLDEVDEAIRLDKAALATFEDLGDKFSTVRPLVGLGYHFTRKDDLETSLSYYQRSLQLNEELGSKGGQAVVLNNMGLIYLWRGDPATGRDMFEESLELALELGNNALPQKNNLGFAYHLLGDNIEARRYFSAVLELFKPEDFAINPIVPEILSGFAMVHASENEPERAVELLSIAIPHPAMNASGDVEDAAVGLFEKLEQELPPDVFAAARDRGLQQGENLIQVYRDLMEYVG